MEKIKVIQIGCGKMSKYIMRYVYEKNSLIVGAVDINEELIGQDIGSIMGIENKGVTISPLDKLSILISNTKPDIAIITTMSTLNDIEEVTRTCLKSGVNVITTCEEAFYGFNSNPSLAREFDILAKANDCTFTGCGYQDVFWGNMIASICGSTHKITKIKGCSSYNVEDYGIALAKAHGAGYTVKEFDNTIASINKLSKTDQKKLMDNRQFFPSYMWNVIGWLADKLGITIKDISQECIPVMCDKTITSETLGLTLEEGSIRGMKAVVKATSEEGILFEVECIGKIYTEYEKDLNEWTVYGEPTTTVSNAMPATVELTCADIVNRLTDVIEAPAGYIPTSQLPMAKYLK